jgi:hypothetical protein
LKFLDSNFCSSLQAVAVTIIGHRLLADFRSVLLHSIAPIRGLLITYASDTDDGQDEPVVDWDLFFLNPSLELLELHPLSGLPLSSTLKGTSPLLDYLTTDDSEEGDVKSVRWTRSVNTTKSGSTVQIRSRDKLCGFKLTHLT